MARIIRSQSAEELDGARLDSATEAEAAVSSSPQPRREVESLFRQPPAHESHLHYSAEAYPPAKEKRSLLKRIRNAFRTSNGPGGTANSRPGRFNKDIRPVVDILPEDHLAAASAHHLNRVHTAYTPYPPQSLHPTANYPHQLPLHQQQLQQQLAQSQQSSAPLSPHQFTADHASDPRLGASLGGSRYAQLPFGQQSTNERTSTRSDIPKGKSLSSGRTRSWRPASRGNSQRNLTVDRNNHNGENVKQNRFLGISRGSSNTVPNGIPGATGRQTGPGNPQSTSAHNVRPHTQRSLPKRVFSSPPSLSARSLVFGSRRKGASNKTNSSKRSNSALGNQNQNFTIPLNPSDLEGKKGGSFGVRQPSNYLRGGGSTSLSVGAGLSTVNNFVSPEHNAEAFKAVVEAAVDGRASFSTLLDAMYRLEERLPPATKDILIKYLSRQDNIEALIDRLTVILPILADDDGVEGPSGQRVRYRHSYVSSILLSNGPMALRRCLFSDAQHLDRLVGILREGYPSDPVLVRSVCKVLLSVLRDSPNDTVAAMMRRRDFLKVLLSHIAVTGCPEVCLSMLSTVRCQQELKFGPPNKRVVCMMADAKLLPTLCDKLASAAEDGVLTSVASATIENCSRVIVGIALRALVIPRYEINDVDDSDTKFYRKFNKDLASLDVFHNPFPILRVLDSGFAAMQTHDERGYALATALTAVRYMLVTVIHGQDSSLSTIRLQLDALNTGAYEAGVRARIPMLARVLQNARNDAAVATMWDNVDAPLGVVRLKILELLVVLLQHGKEKTADAIVEADIPATLMHLFKWLEMNSLLQHMVASIVELSFTIKSCSRVRRAFLIEGRLLECCTSLWNVGSLRRRVDGMAKSNRSPDIVRMSRAVEEFLKDRTSEEVQEVMEELTKSGDDVEGFSRFCETEIAGYERLNTQLLGGAEVPRKMEDGFASFERLAFGSQGSQMGSQGMYLRPRSGAVGLT